VARWSARPGSPLAPTADQAAARCPPGASNVGVADPYGGLLCRSERRVGPSARATEAVPRLAVGPDEAMRHRADRRHGRLRLRCPPRSESGVLPVRAPPRHVASLRRVLVQTTDLWCNTGSWCQAAGLPDFGPACSSGISTVELQLQPSSNHLRQGRGVCVVGPRSGFRAILARHAAKCRRSRSMIAGTQHPGTPVRREARVPIRPA
jgi:hypothetical protein